MGADCTTARLAAGGRPLDVLIATASLGDVRAGTEVYTLHVISELLRRGHRPAIFSPSLGSVAEEARRTGVQVVAHPRELRCSPDVIHGHHHVETMTALLHFPTAPAVLFCHGARFWDDIPLLHPRVRRYVAYDRRVSASPWSGGWTRLSSRRCPASWISRSFASARPCLPGRREPWFSAIGPASARTRRRCAQRASSAASRSTSSARWPRSRRPSRSRSWATMTWCSPKRGRRSRRWPSARR
jgi:hypothetical protein